MKTGKGNKKRVINIDAVKQIEQELADDIYINKFCTALPGVHTFTGCDDDDDDELLLWYDWPTKGV